MPGLHAVGDGLLLHHVRLLLLHLVPGERESQRESLWRMSERDSLWRKSVRPESSLRERGLGMWTASRNPECVCEREIDREREFSVFEREGGGGAYWGCMS